MITKLAELKALIANATPGPWYCGFFVENGNKKGYNICEPENGRVIAVVTARDEFDISNQVLIVEVINTIPALIETIERAQAVAANAERSLYGDETDDPACVDPYLVGRQKIKALRAALAKLGK